MPRLIVQRDQVGAGQHRGFARLIVVEALQEYREAELQGTVEEVRLGEPSVTSSVRVPTCVERLSVSPSPRKLLVEYEKPRKLPEMPETPPLN